MLKVKDEGLNLLVVWRPSIRFIIIIIIMKEMKSNHLLEV